MVKRAKGAYNRRQLEENKNDSKMFWKTVKKIIPTESKELSSGVRIGVLIVAIKFPLRLHLINILLVPSSVLEMLSKPP